MFVEGDGRDGTTMRSINVSGNKLRWSALTNTGIQAIRVGNFTGAPGSTPSNIYDLAISDNEIHVADGVSRPTETAVELRFQTGETSKFYRPTIEGNRIYRGSTGNAIDLRDTTEPSVRRNRIWDPGTNGIVLIDPEYAAISDNYIKDSTGTIDAIEFTGTSQGGNVVKHNTTIGVNRVFNASNALDATDYVELDRLTKTQTWDPPSLDDGQNAAVDVTVSGAELGDVAMASHTKTLTTGMILEANVFSADTVRVTLRNTSGGTQDIASGTLRVVVTKYGS